MSKITRAIAMSHIEIASADLAEAHFLFKESVKRFADEMNALGVELTRIAMETGLDDEGYFLPDLLAAKSETDAALVELEMIIANPN